jgi:hypothetical protein
MFSKEVTAMKLSLKVFTLGINLKLGSEHLQVFLLYNLHNRKLLANISNYKETTKE